MKLIGHIRASVGKEEVELGSDGLSVGELFSLLLKEVPGQVQRHGFSEYNTLLVVNDREAVSAASRREMRLRDGDSVLLVPFSHGG